MASPSSLTLCNKWFCALLPGYLDQHRVVGKEENCDAACQQLWVSVFSLVSLGKVQSFLLPNALGSPLHHKQIYFRCSTQSVKGQARRKVDVKIYRAILTSIFGVGFFCGEFGTLLCSCWGRCLLYLWSCAVWKAVSWDCLLWTALALIPAFDFTDILGWLLFLEGAPGVWT